MAYNPWKSMVSRNSHSIKHREYKRLQTVIEDSKQKRKRGDAKKKSLELFKSGKSINEIANERELNVNTIFVHLASFIISGEVKITDLVPKVHYEELKEIIPKKKFDTLSDLKRQLDDKYSYGELRLVLDELKT